MDALVVTHVPVENLHAQIRAVALPWGLSLAVLSGGLLPLALFLLHLSYRRAARRSAVALAELDDRERRLQEQFAELEHLYRTTPVGLCFMDTELRFVRINDELAAINGASVEEHIGRPPRSILPDVADRIEPIYRRVIEIGDPEMNFEVTAPQPPGPGPRRSYLVSYHPAKDRSGAVIGVSTVVQDVTERKEAEQESRALLADLPHVTRLTTLGEMSSGLAHELNQPLSAIANYTEAGLQMLNAKDVDHGAVAEVMTAANDLSYSASGIISRLRQLVSKSRGQQSTVVV